MKDKVIIIGAGGHARSVMDILLQNNEYEILGCIDNCYGQKQFVEGMNQIAIIGNDDMLEDFYKTGVKYCFVALGSNSLRAKLYRRIVDIGYIPINVVSKYAIISPSVKLGTGICIMAGAILNVNTIIEDNCIINTKCSIDHDCIIGENSHIAPGVTLSGSVKVGNNVQIGTGACVIDGITIGEGAFIGGGGVVVKNVNARMLAYGNPAREIRSLN